MRTDWPQQLKLRREEETGFLDASRMLDQTVEIAGSWSSQGQDTVKQRFHARMSSVLSKGLSGNRPNVQARVTDLIFTF